MQRLLRESGRRLASRSDRQAVEGLRIVQDLHKAEASQLSRSPWLAGALERIGTAPIQYLAHEYMNDAWVALLPCRRRGGPAATPSWNGRRPPTWWRISPNCR